MAGLQAAIELVHDGKVIVLNKGRNQRGSSQYAQGGIAVALGGRTDQETHYKDTLRVGAGLCAEEAVRVLIREGPQRIRDLVQWGAKFDQKGGEFLYAREAAHSRARVLRAKGDSTGEEIMTTLLRHVKRSPGVRLLDHYFVLDLIIHQGICLGALALNERTGRCVSFLAKATILSTGGAGQIYQRTTNPPAATGDGMAIAYRAGATLEDMEFVQFHPTALCMADAPAFLLTEALRGEGAVLRNQYGKAFMERYHPARELAPRDVVTRAIWNEMQEEKSTSVYLDMTHLDRSYLRERFPTIYKTCLSYGLDFTRQPVPVSPAAHFMIGGVKTDLEGRTALKGLFAVGEVACTQVHGANRLASNSLLEGLVFGKRAGQAARRFAKRYRSEIRPPTDIALDLCDIPGPLDQQVPEIQQEIKRVMWVKVGVIRSEQFLKEAIDRLQSLKALFKACYPSRRVMETQNMVTVALLVAVAALQRRGSIGVHYRSDYSKTRGRDWNRHQVFSHSAPHNLP